MAKSAGQVAYEAYARNYPGHASKLAHTWDALSPELRATWRAVAEALGRSY